MKIASIDFETANHSRVSMCAASVAVFKDGELVDSPYWLVKPPKGHGFFLPEWTESCHGLSWFDVKNAPEFSEIADEMIGQLCDADVVIAHNASFDLGVLRAALEHFQRPQPRFQYLCTLQLARRQWPQLPNHQLSTLAAHISCDLQHHQAQSDAIAAGKIMLAVMRELQVRSAAELAHAAQVQFSSYPNE